VICRIRKRRQQAHATFAAGLATLLLLLPLTGSAHHSGAVFYDREKFAELQGVVEGIIWKNPHVRYSLRVDGEDGESELWQLETNSVNSLSRLGITRDIVKVGDNIRVYGILSRLGRKDMRVSNIQMVDGNEVLLMPPLNKQRRWTSEPAVAAGTMPEPVPVDASFAKTAGIFRVWARGDGIDSGPGALFNNESYPLTDAAIEAQGKWDPITDDPSLKCIPYGMPAAMSAPHPIEFVELDDGNILIRTEEFDRERVIRMNGDSRAEERTSSPDGYSIGHWDGEVLVIDTSHLNSPHFDKSGIPLSTNAIITERFVIDDAGTRLDYHVVVLDPQTFLEPVHLYKFWAWNPKEELKIYDCSVGIPD
jgi:hypothetical protein